MTWTLSRRTLTGLTLLAVVAIVLALVDRLFWSGYVCGFIQAWITSLYTVRWTLYNSSASMSSDSTT